MQLNIGDEITGTTAAALVSDQVPSLSPLSEADVTISVTAPKNSTEIILELVSNPILKKLAQQLNDPK